MDRLRSIETFIAVAETGSFAEAARRLGMSAPAATRGVTALEDRVGAKLLTRTTRSVRLTDAGSAYLDETKRILTDLSAADSGASGTTDIPTGTLRITAPARFGHLYITPLLTGFLDAYPDVRVEALFVDRVVNLFDEGLDVAVRIGDLPDSGLTALRVGEIWRVVCGCPTYLAIHGTPQTPEDLKDHQIISLRPSSPVTEWPFKNQAPQKLDARLRLYTVESAIEAASSGWGLTQLFNYQIGPQVAAGTLQTVLHEYETGPLPIHLVHPEGRRPSAKLRCFLNFASKQLRGIPALR